MVLNYSLMNPVPTGSGIFGGYSYEDFSVYAALVASRTNPKCALPAANIRPGFVAKRQYEIDRVIKLVGSY